VIWLNIFEKYVNLPLNFIFNLNYKAVMIEKHRNQIYSKMIKLIEFNKQAAYAL